MKNLLRNVSLALLLLAQGNRQGFSQDSGFTFGFDHILDNREYFTPYGVHQTLFGVRVQPGWEWTLDTLHILHAGVNYMYEFGGELLGVVPQPELWYGYTGNRVTLRLGVFPRDDVLELPLILLTDSLTYYRPNMEGASAAYRWGWGRVHGWIDWMGRASEETREAIHAGFNATLKGRLFRLSVMATRFHLARSALPDDGFRIRDDGSLLVTGGADFSGQVFPGRLMLESGLALFYRQNRPDPYEWFSGWFSRVEAGHGIIGTRLSWYLGDPSPLTYGDRLYRSGNYGRWDLFVDPFRDSRISSTIGWSVHLIPGDGLYHSQQLLLRIRI